MTFFHALTQRRLSLYSALITTLASAGGAVHAQPAGAERAAMPPLRPWLRAPEAKEPIQLQQVQVRAEVVGSSAQTRLELTFHNPNARVLEGELQFPLREGQTVTGFALDLNGEWRAAVPVPKAKGQQVFEDVIRRRVDPALLEVTEGQNYKLRVYPLPPHGSRRVRLDVSESLAGTLRYDLPLHFGGSPVAQMDVRVRLAGMGPLAPQVRAQLGSQPVAVRAENQDAVVELARSHAGSTREALALTVQPPAARSTAGALVSTQSFEGENYFYAEVPVPESTATRTPPHHIGLVWDASGSGEARDHGKEFALLDAYLGTLDEATVHLVVGRDQAEPPRQFVIRRGNWTALRQHLAALPYDGATRLDRLAAPAGVELALLFSDGLGNYGGEGLPASSVPLYAVQAAASADAVRLRAAAERSGGMLLDLNRLPVTDALQQLRTVRARLANLRADQAQDLVSASVFARDGRVRVAGRLTAPEATLQLDWLTPQGQTVTRELKISAPAATSDTEGMAALRWAQLRIAEWEADRPLHRAAIQRLAAAFALPTSETSLIVLEDIGDYVRHDIVPPPSLRPAYEQLQAQKLREADGARSRHLDNIAARFAQEVNWWQRSFPKGDRPSPVRASVAPSGGARAHGGLPQQEGRLREAVAPAPVPAPAAPRAEPEGLELRRSMSAAAAAKPAEPADQKPLNKLAGTPPASASIQLQKWVPDAPYARRLRAAKDADLYAIYLDEKPAYRQSTAFFLDVADLLMERGQAELGLRVLSNLAEMDLQNRHILRILGYRLLQAKQVAQAVPVFEAVRDLSPDEPQSWRDLGLAQAQAGQPQAAIDALWEVVSRPWNERFPDIELIALAELNAIASRAKVAGQVVDTRAIDSRLLRNLPLDLRAVLSWDADNTDIDLWVIDPNGERTFFGNPLSYQGGRISRDVTGGYGPEAFSLREAKPGVYTVKAQFYGHNQQIVAPATTLMLTLTTGFGTEHQQDQAVTLRLSGRGDEVTVGRFEIKGAGR